MGYVIGTDEAGYGPNLGPLLVSATVWQVPDEPWECDLYERLAPTVVARPGRTACKGKCQGPAEQVVWADSKAVYSPQQGIGLLECGVLAALAAIADCPDDWRTAWRMLAPDAAGELAVAPWFVDHDDRLPLAADRDELARLARALRSAFDRSGARLVAIRGRAVFPGEFNQLVEQCGNKATALSRVTLDLAADMIAPLPPAPTLLLCDKHGGRNRYAPLLQQRFPDDLVETRAESRAESVYRFGPAERRMEARFQCRGESALPVALASMCAKYLRELAMRAFNAYWLRHVPGLRPTAGYPTDARRFKRAIRPAQAALGIADGDLWRAR